LSFSDNKNKIEADLSSTSTSTSDSERDARQKINYHSLVGDNGKMKMNLAMDQQKKRELKILINRKINHFLEKHVQIKDGNFSNNSIESII